MEKCLVTAPSMTYAMKAKAALDGNGIKCYLTKLPSEFSGNGCGWGIELACEVSERAVHILDISDIPWKKVVKKGTRT